MSVSLTTAAWVVTGVDAASEPHVVADGGVAHEDGRIVAVGPAEDLRRAYPGAPEARHPHHAMIPGLVNSHHHLGVTPFQHGAPDYALELWFAARLSMRDIDPYLDTLYSAFEMISSGVTTVQHIQGWATGNYDQVHASARSVLAAYRDIGMRVSYCYAVREQNRFVYEDDEAFCRRLAPDLAQDMRAYFAAQPLEFADYMALFDALRAADESPRARIQLAPANLHWMTDDGLLAIGEKAEAAGVPMHMHLLETPYQKEYARRRTGTTAVRHLEKLGLLGPRMTLGHGVWMTEEDIEITAHTGTCVCHNCSSNFRLRSGVLPLMEFVRRGMRVGLGIDEAGINEDRDMLQEMRMALTVHRVPGMDHDAVPRAAQVLRMASEHGAMTTAFGAEIGRLEVGRRMDAVLIDHASATYPYQDTDIPLLDVLIQRARSRDVHAVLIEGEVVYREGVFTNVDRSDALARIADELGRPRSAAERARQSLRGRVFGEVEAFYDGYADAAGPRVPFYAPSSRI